MNTTVPSLQTLQCLVSTVVEKSAIWLNASRLQRSDPNLNENFVWKEIPAKKTGFDRKRRFPIDRKVSEIDWRKKMIFLLMTRKFASAPDRQLTSKLFKRRRCRRRRRRQTQAMTPTTMATMSTEWLDLHDRHLAAENTGCLKTVGMSSISEYDK